MKTAVFAVAAVIYSSTIVVIFHNSKTSSTNSMSRFFFSCLLLLIATLVLIPVAIWYRKRSELIRTIVLAIPNRELVPEIRAGG